ncbi:hypothetical protein CEXT_374161 [Caerostris extrusa]|uniref:Uncharacterized protein n=1 Tax=Caerostris extrusa TaxID=172846 RepID=A0AAV4Y4Y8_CAEEX|nr:hypothetical protein CEXT_374161 [Caerostris extrusa]
MAIIKCPLPKPLIIVGAKRNVIPSKAEDDIAIPEVGNPPGMGRNWIIIRSPLPLIMGWVKCSLSTLFFRSSRKGGGDSRAPE